MTKAEENLNLIFDSVSKRSVLTDPRRSKFITKPAFHLALFGHLSRPLTVIQHVDNDAQEHSSRRTHSEVRA